MSKLPAPRRRWWWLPTGLALVGSLLLFYAARHPPHAPHRLPGARPAVPVARPARGGPRYFINSPLGSEDHITAMGDFDGDGCLDLALTNGTPDTGWSVNTDPQGTITLWLGDGHGQLHHGPVLRDGPAATLLAAFDADADGDTDLLADDALLWRNDGHGRLTPQPLSTSDIGASDLAIGDVDGDGDPDLVGAQGFRLAVGRNDGCGQFLWDYQVLRAQPAADYRDLLGRVALADVDGDHDLDVVAGQLQSRILLNDGYGRFNQERPLPGLEVHSLAVGDLDGDGYPDLVAARNEGPLMIYLNDGRGHYGAASQSQTLPSARPWSEYWVGLADVNRDGFPDVVCNYGEDVWVRLNDGRAQFQPPYRVPTGFSALQELHLADLNHDRQPEILSPIPAARRAWSARRARSARGTLTTLRPPTAASVYEAVDQPPTALDGGPVLAAATAAMQQRLVLPAGYLLNPAQPSYIVDLIVEPDGTVRHVELSYSKIAPAVDSVMADALRHLRLMPGRLHGQPVRVALQLRPPLTGMGPPPTFPPHPLPGEDPIYTRVPQMPAVPDGRPFLTYLREHALNRFILPDNTQLPAHARFVADVVVEKNGATDGYRLVEGINLEVNNLLGSGLSNFDKLVPGRRRGRPVRVALRFVFEPGREPAPLTQSQAERAEAQTRRWGGARRRPGETEAAFLRRVLPLSLASGGEFRALAWRPGAYGRQLFVVRPGRKGENEYGTDLLVLDPYRPRTYALRTFRLTSADDYTTLHDLLVADATGDGRPELLAIEQYDLQETYSVDKHGQRSSGRFAHFSTSVFCLAGTDRAGRPRYRRDATSYEYLDELETPAQVRRALARHRPAPGPAR